jgi:hypothetical protein
MKKLQMRAFLIIAMVFLTISAFSQKKEERNVDSFSGIGLSISGDLYLTQGSPQEVLIEADEDILEKIVTEVKDGVLKIRKQKGWGQNLKNVSIWVTVPEIDGIYLAGSGYIIAEKPVISEEIEINISGSGKVNLQELGGDEIGISISGSGDAIIAGTADEADIAISGSGKVLAKGLEVSECDVRISGSGSCEVNVTGELGARISGSGKVIYFGTPVVDAKVSGSGRVKQGEL